MGSTCAAYLHSSNLHSCTFDSHDVDNFAARSFSAVTEVAMWEFDNISFSVEFNNSSFIVRFL